MLKLNKEVLANWHEDQASLVLASTITLGKETVQNLLAFRFQQRHV